MTTLTRHHRQRSHPHRSRLEILIWVVALAVVILHLAGAQMVWLSLLP